MTAVKASRATREQTLRVNDLASVKECVALIRGALDDERSLSRDYLIGMLALDVECADVHAAGAECAVCNPVVVDGGYSHSPLYARERIEVVTRAVLEAEREKRWYRRFLRYFSPDSNGAWG